MALDNNAIVEELFNSVKYMVDTSIKEAPYDRTVVGIIVGGSATPKHYHVKIQNVTYDLPCYISNKMKPNTPVNVMIPQSNMDFAFIYGMLGGEDGSGIGTVDNAKRAEYAVNAGFANTVAVATDSVVGGLLSSSGKNHVTVSPTGVATVTDVSHADNADNATNATNAQEATHAVNADHATSADVATNVENVPIATEEKVGGIKSSTGEGAVQVNADGTAFVDIEKYELPIASETVLGGIYSSTGPGHVQVDENGIATVPDAGGIKEVPIATETEVGGVISSQESGKLNVGSDGKSTINNVVLIDESGKFDKPVEWGQGPWKLICTEDASLDENNGLPTGGTTGQVLSKNSDTDYDVGWETLSAKNISYGDSNVSSTLDAIKTNIQTNTTNIETSLQSISTLGTTVEQHTIDINTNKTNIVSNTTKLGTVDTKANTNASNITIIQNRLVYYSNPNLLDNWYFADPIDQRKGYIVNSGVTYYSNSALTTSAGTTSVTMTAKYVNSTYGTITISSTTYYVKAVDVVRGYPANSSTIDRWFADTTVPSVQLLEDGIKITSTGGQFFQKIEPGLMETLWGKTVTISVLSNDVLYTATQTLPKQRPSAHTNYAYVYMPNDSGAYIRIYSDANFKSIFAFWAYNTTLNVKAAKLELGNTQTLAHQDSSGNWILNDAPPNPEVELAKCQRYLNVIAPIESNYAEVGIGTASIATSAIIFIPLPTTLRARPAVSRIGLWKLVKYDSWLNGVTVSSITLNQLSSNGVSVVARTESGLETGAVYKLVCVPPTDSSKNQLIFSAEL